MAAVDIKKHLKGRQNQYLKARRHWHRKADSEWLEAVRQWDAIDIGKCAYLS
jgi:hypothetical protein